MKNYKLVISYDGGRYHGWEHKKDVDTVQGKIESVLTRMCASTGKKTYAKQTEKAAKGDFLEGDSTEKDLTDEGMMEQVRINGAGRTDAGVHALAMVANVHMETELICDEIRSYMNRYLPDDIAILQVKEASERFHARFNATGKTYQYVCYDGPSKPVFDRKYTLFLEHSVDIKKMQSAAKLLMGEHDFKSFCGNPKMKKSTVRNVDSIDIRREDGYVYLTFHGNGFLQNMVRILTGTLLEVGYGRVRPEAMTEILEALDRSKAGPTAPAHGLRLLEVDYE